VGFTIGIFNFCENHCGFVIAKAVLCDHFSFVKINLCSLFSHDKKIENGITWVSGHLKQLAGMGEIREALVVGVKVFGLAKRKAAQQEEGNQSTQ
jgi:hypothetical protein